MLLLRCDGKEELCAKIEGYDAVNYPDYNTLTKLHFIEGKHFQTKSVISLKTHCLRWVEKNTKWVEDKVRTAKHRSPYWHQVSPV